MQLYVRGRLGVCVLWLGLWLASSTHAAAQSVWCGPKITYQQPAQGQADVLSPSVALNRGFSQGLYNSAQESSYTSTSPAGTEWALGTTANYSSLTFQPWRLAVGENPPSALGQDMVVHLIAQDIYLDLRFTAWATAPGSTSRFTYERSTPGACATSVPLPSWAAAALALFLLLFGALSVRRARARALVACALSLFVGACGGGADSARAEPGAADAGASRSRKQPASADSTQSSTARVLENNKNDDEPSAGHESAAANGCNVDNGGCGDARYNTCAMAASGSVECSALDPCAQDNGGCGDPRFNACTGERGSRAVCSDIDECARENGGCGDTHSYACNNQRNAAPSCDRRWSVAAAGSDHVCAIANSGELYCWGANDSGQLGLSDLEPRTSPTRVGSGTDWSSVAASGAVTCAIRASKLYCWGDNYFRQLGSDAIMSDVPAPVGTGDGWETVALGEAHACGVRRGRLYCWGVNDLGQLGDGSYQDRTGPSEVSDLEGWTFVACGASSSCGIRAGELHCWGDNSAGQLGDGAQSASHVPLRIGSADDWTELGLGGDTVCALRAGSLHCWGDNTSGKLGLGATNVASDQPQLVGEHMDWTSIEVGARAACGTRAGELHCWGENAEDSHLGVDSDAVRIDKPARVGDGQNWKSVSGIGAGFFCVIGQGDGLYCWGKNASGQLGRGATSAYEPVPARPD